MKLLILVLILSIFIQTAFLPINLFLIILICRNFLTDRPTNYFYAFCGGIFLGLMSYVNLGFWPLVFIVMTKVIQLIKLTPISSKFFIIIPASFLIILTVGFLEQIFLNQSLSLEKVIIETLLIIPIFFVLKIWEERFIVRSDIRLKIKR